MHPNLFDVLTGKVAERGTNLRIGEPVIPCPERTGTVIPMRIIEVRPQFVERRIRDRIEARNLCRYRIIQKKREKQNGNKT
jgi:hypothetical protein